ncbi:hypothetical protein [Agathobaculum sp. Marseille-P7918]|uniref:hypothetical protein n=1 Tax=Agathobaculum sp. Marseille-P7918 TaxID=2479843 RepID=UPI00356914DF
MAKLDTMSIVVTAINLCLWLAILVGLIALQAWLSRRKAWWPGLVMPVLSFLMSLLIVVGNFVFLSQSSMVSGTQVVDEQTGAVVYQAQQVQQAHDWAAGDTARLGVLLLVSNIPTIVLLAVYFLCRRSQKHKKQLDKMNIQDL